MLLEHFDNMLSYYGTEAAIPIARKHIAWYSKNLPNAVEFRTRIFQEKEPQSIISQINAFYAQAIEYSIKNQQV